MAAVDLATGSTFGARYRILGRLASGGMGAVYEVLHVETQRRRALKVMLPDLVAKAELRDRFRRESQVTARVASEYLVDVFDAGVDESTGMPFLVMELLQGEDLGRLVARAGALPADEVVEYLRQVASALDRTHAAHIVHRDLKPENLFLTRRDDGSECIKILDFGISKILDESASSRPSTTSIGTPAYMAPEQIVGGPVTAATDVSALGLIAYTLLVGRAYWQDDVDSTDNVLAFALRAAQGVKESAVTRAARHGRVLPPEFDAWFALTGDIDPARRFASASTAVFALSEALGVSIEAPRSAAPTRRFRPAAEHRAATSEPQVASTMLGTELGPGQRSRRSGFGRWLVAGALVGFVAFAVVALLARFAGDEARRASVGPAPPVQAVPMPVSAPDVKPVEPVPLAKPSATSPSELAPRATSTARNTKRLPASTPPTSASAVSSEPSAPNPAEQKPPGVASAAFDGPPVASAGRKIKHTRD